MLYKTQTKMKSNTDSAKKGFGITTGALHHTGTHPGSKINATQPGKPVNKRLAKMGRTGRRRG